MEAVIWKAVFAALSPSPVFEVIAQFAQARADQRRTLAFKETLAFDGRKWEQKWPTGNEDATSNRRNRNIAEFS
jgi:hypothetical protein